MASDSDSDLLGGGNGVGHRVFNGHYLRGGAGGVNGVGGFGFGFGLDSTGVGEGLRIRSRSRIRKCFMGCGVGPGFGFVAWRD